MKSILLLPVMVLLLNACSKAKTTEVADTVPTTGMQKLKGTFYATAGISVSGQAKIISDGGQFSLLLDSLQVSSGPDLKVYLSKRDTPFEFINLGPLKSNSGSQSYAIPAGVDFNVHSYVLIHCQQYNHLFAIAQLKP